MKGQILETLAWACLILSYVLRLALLILGGAYYAAVFWALYRESKE